jgi:hypothetical protein
MRTMNFQGLSLPDNPLDEIKRVASKGGWQEMPFDIDSMLAAAPVANTSDINTAHYKRSVYWFSDPERITASVVYPPSGGMGWHTNSGLPGWRAYLSWSETGDSGMGWLRDGEVVLDYDKPGWNIRMFQVPAWHCVFARCWRCSVGVRPEITKTNETQQWNFPN